MTEETIENKPDIGHLWFEYQQNKTAEVREKLINHYLTLVKVVAGRIAMSLPQHIDKDDLISNGFFGLLDAIERYDPVRGIKFETYAVARIRGSMIDSLRAQDWIPTTIRQKARQYENALNRLEIQFGRAATDAEVAAELGITLEQLYHLLGQINACTIIPLEDFVKSEIPGGPIPNPAQHIEEQEIRLTLTRAIDKLPEKERLVVALYYYEGLTLKEISMILKLSEARISQLHTKAVFRLRGFLSRIKSSLL